MHMEFGLHVEMGIRLLQKVCVNPKCLYISVGLWGSQNTTLIGCAIVANLYDKHPSIKGRLQTRRSTSEPSV